MFNFSDIIQKIEVDNDIDNLMKNGDSFFSIVDNLESSNKNFSSLFTRRLALYDVVGKLWAKFPEDFQKSNIKEAFDRYPEYIKGIWGNTSPEIQKENSDLLLSTLNKLSSTDDSKRSSFYNDISVLWKNTCLDLQGELFGNLAESFPDYFYDIWKSTFPEVQEKNSDLLLLAMNNIKNKPNSLKQSIDLSTLWHSTTPNVQRQNILDVLENFSEFSDDFWFNTLPEVQEESFLNVYEKFPTKFMKIWKNTVPEVQEKNSDLLIPIINSIVDSEELTSFEMSYEIEELWRDTIPNIQVEKLPDVVENFPEFFKEFWENSSSFAQKENSSLLVSEIAKVVESTSLNDFDKPYKISSLWRNTRLEAQKVLFEEVSHNFPDYFGDIWKNTNLEVKKENSDLLVPGMVGLINSQNISNHDKFVEIKKAWESTIPSIQGKTILDLLDNSSDFFEIIWKNTDSDVQLENAVQLFDSIKYFTDEDGNKLRNDEKIKAFFRGLNPQNVMYMWENMDLSERKENLKLIFETLNQSSETQKYVSEILQKESIDIDIKKFSDILSMNDENVRSYIGSYLIDRVLDNMDDNNNVDIDSLSSEINNVHSIFLTNNLPEVFKTFEFFKYHPNYNNNNLNFYDGVSVEDRDKTILQDLFSTNLDSDNSQLKNFLELLYNGNVAYGKCLNGDTLEEYDEAIISAYATSLKDLYRIYSNETIDESLDSYETLEHLRNVLSIDSNADIGDALLSQFLDEIGFDKKKYVGSKPSISENLLDYMARERIKAIKRNVDADESSLLEEGDLIKGFDIEFLDPQLRSGIKSKEFYMNGSIESDFTPFDTDFSEITRFSLNGDSLYDIVDHTISSAFGDSYYVIKKGDFDEEKSCSNGYDPDLKSRVLRTSIGSNSISYLLTSNWDDKYGYVMAQNGMFFKVFDLESGKLVFSPEQYFDLRDKMKGLSFYGAEDFEVDETAKNSTVFDLAKSMRDNASHLTSTEEKRSKLLSLIKSILPNDVIVENMAGDLSSDIVELIDTGSTGRGTNIPGDGDFDFMLKCSNSEHEKEIIRKLDQALLGDDDFGTNDFNIRKENVRLDGISEPVDVDISSEDKSLRLNYSSDLCVKDRLNNIRKVYGDEIADSVIDNIIVAKKFLKDAGLYKKMVSNGSTNFGGFGGIGIENWILQNGGSFVLAMETFLDNTKDKDGNDIGFFEFKDKYPIYDFGLNHRSKLSGVEGLSGHDSYIDGLSSSGYKEMKKKFKEFLLDLGVDYVYDPDKCHEVAPIEPPARFDFVNSIKDYSLGKVSSYKMSDAMKGLEYIQKFKAKQQLAERSKDMSSSFGEKDLDDDFSLDDF